MLLKRDAEPKEVAVGAYPFTNDSSAVILGEEQKFEFAVALASVLEVDLILQSFVPVVANLGGCVAGKQQRQAEKEDSEEFIHTRREQRLTTPNSATTEAGAMATRAKAAEQPA